jgi:hypothetical protein
MFDFARFFPARMQSETDLNRIGTDCRTGSYGKQKRCAAITCAGFFQKTVC